MTVCPAPGTTDSEAPAKELPTIRKPRLKGAELLEFVAGRYPTDEIAIEAGYAKLTKGKDGAPRVSVQKNAFMEAMLVAGKICEGPARPERNSGSVRPRSYLLKPSKTNGSLILSTGYLAEAKEQAGISGEVIVAVAIEGGVITLSLNPPDAVGDADEADEAPASTGVSSLFAAATAPAAVPAAV